MRGNSKSLLIMDIHTYIIHNTPPWMFINKYYCASLKPYQEKPNGKKNLVKEKRVHNIFQSCLIKNLARKTQWDKTIDKGKRVQRILLPLFTT